MTSLFLENPFNTLPDELLLHIMQFMDRFTLRTFAYASGDMRIVGIAVEILVSIDPELGMIYRKTRSLSKFQYRIWNRALAAECSIESSLQTKSLRNTLRSMDFIPNIRASETGSLQDYTLISGLISQRLRINIGQAPRDLTWAVLTRISTFQNISRLSLIGLHMTTIPLEIFDITSLKRLFLQNNQITYVPPDIERLSNLTELRLCNNKIPYLPDTLVNLEKLEILYISFNGLEFLPDGIEDMPCLSELNMTYNNLQVKPDGLSKIRVLYS